MAHREGIHSIAVDSGNNVYVSGIINGNMVIQRYSPDGTLDTSFNITLGTTSNDADYPQLSDIAISTDGTVYVMYNFLTIKKISAAGTVDNAFTIDYSTTDNTITSIAVDNNDILCVAGSGKDLLGSGITTDYDGYVRFYDSDGSLKDEKVSGNENEDDFIRSITVDSKNNIYFGGRSFNAVASDSSWDWWIAKIPGYGGE